MKNLCPIAKILVLIGALNLGLMGVGDFIGANLDVVDMVLGGIANAVSIFNVLVGLGAVVMLAKCKKCA